MADKQTAPRIRAMKGGNTPVVCVTAYDATFGALADTAGVDVILVGDSVGNVSYGYSTTLPVTLDQMVMHTRATRAGVSRALLVADLPFGTYESSVAQAVDSAVLLMKAGAEAVKLEGAYVEAIAAICRAGIPVMGHVGMTPQSINRFGGFRVQGRGEAGSSVLQDAKAVDDAGVFATVLELVPGALAREITPEVSNPTIGIGAGIGCDGQIQVMHDILGLSRPMKHARQFFNGTALITEALATYAASVRSRSFPTDEETF